MDQVLTMELHISYPTNSSQYRGKQASQMATQKSSTPIVYSKHPLSSHSQWTSGSCSLLWHFPWDAGAPTDWNGISYHLAPVWMEWGWSHRYYPIRWLSWWFYVRPCFVRSQGSSSGKRIYRAAFPSFAGFRSQSFAVCAGCLSWSRACLGVVEWFLEWMSSASSLWVRS